MKRSVTRWVLAAVAVVVLAVIAALAAVPFLVDTPRAQALIASNASQTLGRPVKFTGVSVRVFPLPAIELHGLEVADDPAFGPTPFLRLDTGYLELQLRPLLAGRVEFGDLVLKRPVITLIQNPDGRWNFASLGAAHDSRALSRGGRGGSSGGGGTAAAGAVLASRAKIDKGLLTYEVRSSRDALSTYRVEDLELTVTGGGTALHFEGAARVKPGDLDVKITGGRVGLNGARALGEAPVAAQVAISGKDVEAVVAAAAGPTPALSGPIKGALTVSGTVASPRASGEVELAALKVTQTNPQCPEPKRRTLALGPTKLAALWEAGTFRGRPVSTSLGRGALTTNVTATLEGGVRVQLADVTVRALPLDTLLVDFLCQGYAVTGPLDLTGTASLRPTDPWKTLSGAGQLKIGPGKVVGPQALSLLGGVARLAGALSSMLSADLPPSLFASPLDFDSITGTYQITNGLVTTRDLVYTSRGLKVTVAGEYALPTGRMNLDLLVNHGRGEIQAKVTGSSASPSIQIVPASVLRQVVPGKVERGLQDLLKRLR